MSLEKVIGDEIPEKSLIKKIFANYKFKTDDDNKFYVLSGQITDLSDLKIVKGHSFDTPSYRYYFSSELSDKKGTMRLDNPIVHNDPKSIYDKLVEAYNQKYKVDVTVFIWLARDAINDEDIDINR